MYIVNTTMTSTTANTIRMAIPPEPAPVVPVKASIERDVLLELSLRWWRLRMSHDDPKTVEYGYAKRGYFGVTVNCMSDLEWKSIKEWVKARANDVYMTKRDWGCGGERRVVEFIGDYKDYCIGVWCRTQAKLDEFCDLLESFPERTKALVMKNPKAAMQFLKGSNYKIIKGSESFAVGVGEDIDPTDMMLLLLAAT